MEHIKNIEIKNFKSIRHQKIEDCRRINVFIGYPNTGKSNLLEALGLYGASLLDKGEHFRLNNLCRVKHFSELFFNQEYRIGGIININNEFDLSLELVNNAQNLELRFAGLHGEITDIQKDHNGYLRLNVDQNMVIQQRPTSFKTYNGDPRVPLFPIKKYSFTNESIGVNIDSLSLNIPFGNNLLDVLQREAGLRREIGEILNPYGFKLLLDTTSGTIMLIKEIDESSVLRIPYHQIADTLQRLIFYKAAITSNRNAVLLFEEPEAHMFPPYISKFTSDIWFNKENQYFITSHSPFVVNDFLENAKEELAIYILEYKNGESVIKRLSDEQLTEAYQYGIDLFFNLESLTE